LIERIQGVKNEIENFKIEAQQAERQGNYGRVAELRYGKIKEAETAMEMLNGELQAQQSDKALIQEEVTSNDIAEVVARWTGIPVSRMLQTEREKLLTLEAELHKRVVGQDEAIAVVSDAVRRNRAGLSDPKRPIGSFIFIGSTGVGKTELARTLAEFLFNDENLMTRIDMSEYQERHSVSRLVGAPPGYVGYDEGGQLTEAVRHKPYSVVLLDEIEKAHPDVFNILLQVLDDGRLTDNKGRTVNFKNTIIIMTSNIKDMDMLKQTIRPEFINRIDEMVVFKPLMKEEIKEVVKLQIKQLQKMLKTQGIDLQVGDATIEWLADAGYDPQFGARPVKRVIQKNILNELSKQILSGNVQIDKPVIMN
jgi:ATP-dependent Clp protease ATP-binding subunit ClpB